MLQMLRAIHQSSQGGKRVSKGCRNSFRPSNSISSWGPTAASSRTIHAGDERRHGRMDRQMASAPMNGDVDHDFAAMMIPHHQGAIDMAKAELIYGKDPVMRRLAQEILIDQQSEIDAMQLWLEKTALS